MVNAQLIEQSIDPKRNRPYFKVEAEWMTLKESRSPGCDQRLSIAPTPPSVKQLPLKPSGDQALFFTGSGQRTEAAFNRDKNYRKTTDKPYGDVASIKLRFTHPGSYDLFVRLAYWPTTGYAGKTAAAPSGKADGRGGMHVSDFTDPAAFQMPHWRKHTNSAWNIFEDRWKVVDMGPGLIIRPEDLENEGYLDIMWTIAPVNPGLIIDSFVLYQGHAIDPGAKIDLEWDERNRVRYHQESAYDGLSFSKKLEKSDGN